MMSGITLFISRLVRSTTIPLLKYALSCTSHLSKEAVYKLESQRIPDKSPVTSIDSLTEDDLVPLQHHQIMTDLAVIAKALAHRGIS